MDWLTYCERIAALEVKVSPLRIVRGETEGLRETRVLEGVLGGFMVEPASRNAVWLSDGSHIAVEQ